MTQRNDRRPWNPFPLACLTVEGLSACAKAVLIYLGVRSDYRGMTCVGHRRMCQDLVRSKDFVTRGLAELEEAGYVSKSQRNRHKHQADWRTLSASLILKSRTENQDQTSEISPEEQDQASKSSPDFGKSSPDHQGKTSQIDSNLPDSSLNLSDQNQGRKEGTKEALPLASLATGPMASITSEELEQVAGRIWEFWREKTKTYLVEDSDGTWSDEAGALHLIRQYGWDEVWSILRGTFECPKTAGIIWSHNEKTGLSAFGHWVQNYERTRGTVNAWRNKIKAQAGVKAAVANAGKPAYHSGDEDFFAHAKGIPTVCAKYGSKCKEFGDHATHGVSSSDEVGVGFDIDED